MLNNVVSIFSGVAAAGDYESIATVTVGSGGAANVEFTSIPSTFTHLEIRAIARTARVATRDSLSLQFNGDTASNYSTHELNGDGSSATSVGSGSTTAIEYAGFAAASTATASIFGVLIISILDYGNTNKYKTIRVLEGVDTNGAGKVGLSSGSWRNTNAVTSIKLFSSTGANNFQQYSHFALYGIKSA